MSIFLDRIDSAPILGEKFTFEFGSWVTILVDTLNENIADIQAALISTTIVTGTSQDVEANSLYIPTNVALTSFQLPDSASVGDRVSIAGLGAGGWILLTGSGQTIQIADVGASAGTSVASASRYDSIEIICVEEDTTWITLSTQTLGFVIV